jgi:hypothetical protein
MKAVFIELPAFERHRAVYLDDNGFRDLQNLLMKHPEAGDPIPDSGGLRNLRFRDARRGKGKAGRFASDLLLVKFGVSVLAFYYLRQG